MKKWKSNNDDVKIYGKTYPEMTSEFKNSTRPI